MMSVNFYSHIQGRYYHWGDWVTSTSEDTQRAVNAVFAVKPEWELGSVISLEREPNSLTVVVDPFTRYVSLHWTTGLQSLNPEPFKNAHLIPDDTDVDPYYSFYKRDSYISEQDARQAVWEYINTGNRPTNIQWQVLQYEVYELPPWGEDPESRSLYTIISPGDHGINPYYREPDDPELLYKGYTSSPMSAWDEIKEVPF